MLQPSNIRRALFLIVLLLTMIPLSSNVIAQEGIPSARKFDEFEGPVGSCDFGARLDNFAIELQNDPTAEGYIIWYGPEAMGAGNRGFREEYVRDYLTNARGLDAGRIKTIYGGRYKELKSFFIDLWIVPPGATSPEPVAYESSVKTFTGKFSEYTVLEGGYGGEGIPQGNVTLSGFADVLAQQPESLAYVVAENTKAGTPGAWRRAANEVVANLSDNYKVQVDRIKVICAGYDGEAEDESEQAKVQLWVLPKDAPPPVTEVTEPEPKPERAFRLRMFGAYELLDEADRHDVFGTLADVLSHDKESNVCIIVHQQSAEQHAAEPKTGTDEQHDKSGAVGEQEPTAEFHLPDVDLMKVSGKWQADLAKDYGISQERLIIISGSAEDWNYGMIEVWIVPPGAALPGPEGDNVTETEDGEETVVEDSEQVEIPEVEPLEMMK